MSTKKEECPNTPLEKNHLQDLQGSGLSKETIQQNKIYSASSEEVQRLLHRDVGPGLVFSYGSEDYVRVKPDTPPTDKDGKPCKYLSRSGSGNHVYFPHGVLDKLKADPAQSLIITEGEKKALKATQEGFLTIAIPGVWCFTDKKQDGLIADFDLFSLKNRPVFICFDSDRAGNLGTLKAEYRLAQLLQQKGAVVKVIELPQASKADKKIGLDDFLVKNNADKLNSLIAAAKTVVIPELTFIHYAQQRCSTCAMSREEFQQQHLPELAKSILNRTSIQQDECKKLLAEKPIAISPRAFNKDLKQLRKENPVSNPMPKMSARFPGLVDIVWNAKGKPVFLHIDNNVPTLSQSVTVNGETLIPPDADSIPFPVKPRARKTLSRITKDGNRKLLLALVAYFRKLVWLPDKRLYRFLAIYAMHTYLLDMQQKSPILWLYAVAQRGKTRTGTAIVNVSYRGLHVESVRESFIIRMAQNFGATLFFDVTDLAKKLERHGSEDLLLLRFDKGAKTARVLNPDAGAFKDTSYFDIYGATIVATNQPIEDPLDSRCIQIVMKMSSRKFETDVTPDFALSLRERLVAFRARCLMHPLPEVEKPVQGRLGDIMQPLYQIVMAVCPKWKDKFMKLISKEELEHRERLSHTNEGMCLHAVAKLCRNWNEDFVVSVKKIKNEVNKEFGNSRIQYCDRTIGRCMTALGFKRARLKGNTAGKMIKIEQLKKMMAQYGIKHPKHPQHPPTGK